LQEKTRPFSSKEKFLDPELSKDFDHQVSKQVGEIIPPYDPEIPKIEKLKRVFRRVFLVVVPVILLAFFGYKRWIRKRRSLKLTGTRSFK